MIRKNSQVITLQPKENACDYVSPKNPKLLKKVGVKGVIRYNSDEYGIKKDITQMELEDLFAEEIGVLFNYEDSATGTLNPKNGFADGERARWFIDTFNYPEHLVPYYISHDTNITGQTVAATAQYMINFLIASGIKANQVYADSDCANFLLKAGITQKDGLNCGAWGPGATSWNSGKYDDLAVQQHGHKTGARLYPEVYAAFGTSQDCNTILKEVDFWLPSGSIVVGPETPVVPPIVVIPPTVVTPTLPQGDDMRQVVTFVWEGLPSGTYLLTGNQASWINNVEGHNIVADWLTICGQTDVIALPSPITRQLVLVGPEQEERPGETFLALRAGNFAAHLQGTVT